MIKRAIVKDNDDPENLGRIKVQLYGDLTEEPIDNLPWVTALETFTGNQDAGSFVVPDIDTSVFVLMENQEFDEMVYFGSWHIDSDKIEESNKPTVRVLYKSTTGHTILIDDTVGEEKLRIIDRLGQSIEFDCPSDSNVNKRGTSLASEGNGIDSNQDASIKITTVDGSKVELLSRNNKTTINVSCEDVNLTCKKIKINGGGARVLTTKDVPFCRYTGEKFLGSDMLETGD